MTVLLRSAANPGGSTTEQILKTVRADVIERMQGYAADPRPEIARILAHNIRILGLLTEAIELAEANTKILSSSE
ncbi:histidine kinase [Azospirillum griseum]|uniref:Histidine kinase n=1 Tax=Azospirillum griseum TaxID=2496639 RepID=A0A431VE79_9PROT|nr:histidine kinase [Azospirillum griseum]RTR17826.1 histidine kinase [Azospirillum griseum]